MVNEGLSSGLQLYQPRRVVSLSGIGPHGQAEARFFSRRTVHGAAKIKLAAFPDDDPSPVHGAAKIKLAAFPDDDPSLVIDVPLDPVEPQARVMSVQFVRENDGYLAVS
jgi:hypothetical protein